MIYVDSCLGDTSRAVGIRGLVDLKKLGLSRRLTTKYPHLLSHTSRLVVKANLKSSS